MAGSVVRLPLRQLGQESEVGRSDRDKVPRLVQHQPGGAATLGRGQHLLQPLIDPRLAPAGTSAFHPRPDARRRVQRPLDRAGRVVVVRHGTVRARPLAEREPIPDPGPSPPPHEVIGVFPELGAHDIGVAAVNPPRRP